MHSVSERAWLAMYLTRTMAEEPLWSEAKYRLGSVEGYIRGVLTIFFTPHTQECVCRGLCGEHGTDFTPIIHVERAGS